MHFQSYTIILLLAILAFISSTQAAACYGSCGGRGEANGGRGCLNAFQCHSPEAAESESKMIKKVAKNQVADKQVETKQLEERQIVEKQIERGQFTKRRIGRAQIDEEQIEKVVI